MKNISTILQDMKSSGMKTDVVTTGYVAAYELGIFLQQNFYAAVRGEDLREGHIAHASTELADCIMQLRCLAELDHLDWNTLISMGEDKLYERIGEFNSKQRPRPVDELQKGPAPRASSAYTYNRSGD